METPEYSLTILVAASTLLFIVGLGMGLLLGRRMSPGGQNNRDTERKLDQVLQDKKAYEDEVVEHFTDTARLLNNLTESYRNVHNHLSAGAGSLCQGKGPVSLDRLEDGQQDTDIPADMADIRPPLDYAPKTSPDEKGMLNEEFGIERTQSPGSPQEPEKTLAGG